MQDRWDAFWSLSASEVLQHVGSGTQGLTTAEAALRARRFGANALKARKHAGDLTLLLGQFRSPIILILLFAAVLSFFLHDSADAVIILAIVLVSGLLGFWQERGAAHAVEKLLALVQTTDCGAAGWRRAGDSRRGGRAGRRRRPVGRRDRSRATA